VCATLLLVDAERATRKRDTSFAVTIVGKQGEGVTVDYATAISLTFLRESLGVPMTEASRVYARALARDDGIRVGGARVAFVTLDVSATDAGPRHGLRVET
jgi:hypothetical protein